MTVLDPAPHADANREHAAQPTALDLARQLIASGHLMRGAVVASHVPDAGAAAVVEQALHALRHAPGLGVPHGPLPPAQSLDRDARPVLAGDATIADCLALLRALLIGQRWTELDGILAEGKARWPGEPAFLYVEGQRARTQAQWALAATHYAAFLACRPDTPDALANLGMCHLNLGQFDTAVDCFEQAIKAAPDHVFSWRQLGYALGQLGAMPLAERVLWHAHEQDPSSADTASILSWCLYDQRPLSDAQKRRFGELASAQLANPHASAAVLANIAATLCRMNLWPAVVEVATRSIQLDPAASNNAYASLMQGAMQLHDLRTGWNAMERIWADRDAERLGLAGPAWTGEPLQGRTLVLYAVGGFGDTLQFSRLLDHVHGGPVVMICHASLQSLLQRSFPRVKVLTEAEWLASDIPYHFQMRLMSLAHVLQIHHPSQIPAPASYLVADPVEIDAWRAYLAHDTQPRIGLAWRGSMANPFAQYRSVPFAQLGRLRELDGFSFYSLPRNDEAAADLRDHDATGWVYNVDDKLTDFSATTTLMQHLDLVITVCTSTAHLAGAAGCPTWLLLSEEPCCWRWFNTRDKTAWYPKTRVFRQTEVDAWEPVLERVVNELRQLGPEGLRKGRIPRD